MRDNMRRSMRSGGVHHLGGSSAMMHGDDKEYWYRMGYRDGYDAGGEDEADFRRMRDSRGRFV